MKATIRLVGEELVALLDDGRELTNFDAEALADLLWNTGIRAGDLQAVDWHTDVKTAPTAGQKIAIFSRLRKYENASCEQKVQEGRESTIRELLALPIWLSREELSRFVSAHAGTIDKIDVWIRERKVFAVENEGEQLFAAFQFDEAGAPRKVIAEILHLLQCNDNWTIASWLAFPNGWITAVQNGKTEAVAPMYQLDDEEAILRAARNEQEGTYFA